MSNLLSRRDLIRQSAVALGAAAVPLAVGAPAVRGADDRSARTPGHFSISLNTSTVREHQGRKLSLLEIIDIAAAAGYSGIEPWPGDLEGYVRTGASLADLRKRLADKGLAVTGAIAFFPWMVDDDAQRAKALDDAKRYMHELAEIGATHVAAPPAGNVSGVDLLKAAERYRALLDLAEPIGVVPAVEVWGFRDILNRLGQAVLVALEAQHPKACVLPDVYHLYKGGSGLSGVAKLNGSLLGGFHLNDYPADPPRDKIADKDRVYPGDGVAPLKELLRDLKAIGYRGPLSIELFNPSYWKEDPAVVARTALEKSQRVMHEALG
jgi:sugar phosphate isomerase/epimerase